MAETSLQARKLIDEADKRKLVLLVDHTFIYTGAVRKMAELIKAGDLGRVYYYDSVRVNLGLFQRDVSVISDLAVHDFAILEHLLEEHPTAVSASGVNHFPGTPENLAFITLFYDSGTIAHVNVNWLAPVKVRQILVGGSKKMITYDDLEPSEKIKIYDKGVSFTDDPQQIYEMRVGYRTGDMWAPKLDGTEALSVEGEHFVDCIINAKAPTTDGRLGLRVVELIEAATSSMRGKGETVYLPREGEHIVIPFVDLKAQYASIKQEVNAAIQGVLDSCQFTLGPEVAKLEEEFAAYSGASIGIGVNTGTSALHLALLAADVGPGDEVITVPFTFVATVSAIRYTRRAAGVRRHRPAHLHDGSGAASKLRLRRAPRRSFPCTCTGRPPTWIRSSPSRGSTGSSSSRTPARPTAPSTRAGAPAAWATWAASASIPARTWVRTAKAAWSSPTTPDYARTIRMLRDWGAEKKYEHVLKGYNFRLEGLQGAVLRVKLRHLEAWTEARRAAAARYDHLLDGVVPTPDAPAHNRHVYHVYAIRTADRAVWQKALTAHGIQTGIHYPTPIHLLPAHTDLGYREGQFPHSEKAAREVLSLPMYPELSGAQVETVARAVAGLVTQPAQRFG